VRFQRIQLALEAVLMGDPQCPAVGIVGPERQRVEPGGGGAVAQMVIALEPRQRFAGVRQPDAQQPEGKSDEQDGGNAENAEPHAHRHELGRTAHHEKQCHPDGHHRRECHTPDALEGQADLGQADLAAKPRCRIVAHPM
jgi:hypothetical protein